jgi:hypothetical protein
MLRNAYKLPHLFKAFSDLAARLDNNGTNSVLKVVMKHCYFEGFLIFSYEDVNCG